MNVLCQLDRPMLVGGRAMILLDGVSAGFLLFNVYVLGENNNNPWRESGWNAQEGLGDSHGHRTAELAEASQL